MLRLGPSRQRHRGALLAGAALACGLALVALRVASEPQRLPEPHVRSVDRSALRPPTIGGCPAFPLSHPLNQKVDELSVAPNSREIIANIGLRGIQPDFDSKLESVNGIPFVVVPSDQPKVPIRFTEYPEESDPGPYPIPPDPPIEGWPGNTLDRHVLVVQEETCMLYELYHAHKTETGWDAGSGATWNLRTGAPRPAGWTSADAAGLPIAPLLVRFDEVANGRIAHAIRVTVPRSRRAYIAPAQHWAAQSDDVDLPAMGLRLRLRADYDISDLPPQARVIAQALKTYGFIVADNGPAWEFQGAPDTRWDDEQIQRLRDIPADAFEALDSGTVVTP
ncbi:MAG: hypothetical protein CSA62_00080 [Planctomycetota bacterium]|nr:MAG: hypothetical protein CSA62_00080 [Planctomycetota bacterium]